jgi:hypothetical protein
MRACPYKDDDVAIQPINEKEVATDVAFAVINPFAFERVVQPFGAERRIVAYEQKHGVFQSLQVVTT